MHPRSLALCDWEGAVCVIAQDVVSNDVHVRFRTGPGHSGLRTAENLAGSVMGYIFL